MTRLVNSPRLIHTYTTRRAQRFPACVLTPWPGPLNKVALVFTNLTWLLVGSRSEDFSTPGGAWRSVIRVSLGEYESFYPQILGAQPAVGPVIVVVYQVLAVVLLLNVVIAVLVEVWYSCCCCCCFSLVWCA